MGLQSAEKYSLFVMEKLCVNISIMRKNCVIPSNYHSFIADFAMGNQF